ncbi:MULTISPECIES: hypothetical protein [unclassified Nostoc]|nr:hypothetical protein [Nostoc sp. S13]MDF5737020.1 hypothetical protein [Nostoc sp. S13]
MKDVKQTIISYSMILLGMMRSLDECVHRYNPRYQAINLVVGSKIIV